MTRYPLVVCFVFVLGFGCKRKERPQLFIDQTTKDYCVYKAGSYWVYKEDSSGKLDTLSIYGYNWDMVYIRDYHSHEFESIRMPCIWSTVGHTNHVIEIDPELYGFPLHAQVNERSPYNDVEQRIFYAFDSVGQSLGRANFANLILIAQYDSLDVLGRVYKDVMEFNTSDDRTVLWGKHVGRLKFESYSGETWSLVEYIAIQ